MNVFNQFLKPINKWVLLDSLEYFVVSLTEVYKTQMLSSGSVVKYVKAQTVERWRRTGSVDGFPAAPLKLDDIDDRRAHLKTLPLIFHSLAADANLGFFIF